MNNTWNALFIGFSEHGFFCTANTNPSGGNKSEGVQISNSVLVYCNKAIRCDAVTNLAVSNCVLDFCGAQGIFCTNGQAVLVTNNWFAGNTDASFLAVGVSPGFTGGSITNNFITEGATPLASAVGVSLTGPDISVIGNVFSNIAGGVSTQTSAKNIGNIYIGGKAEITSSANVRLDNEAYVQSGTTAGTCYTAETPSGYTGVAIFSKGNAVASSTVWAHAYGSYSGGSAFFIRGNGSMENATGSYGVFSDEKLKQDITDASSQWDDIKNIRFRKYRLKADVAEDPNAYPMFGIVAQELEQTSPGLVSDSPVMDEDGNQTGETIKSVKQSLLLMKAAKALQEAMERIEVLEARMDGL